MKHEAAVVRSVPFGIYIGGLVLLPLAAGALPDAWDERWLYGAQAGLVAVVLGLLWSRYHELRERPRAADLALGVGVGVLVFVAWVNLDLPFLALGTASGFDPRDGTSVRWDLALTRMAGAALVVPIMEELFWRSFLLRWLEKPRFLEVLPGEVGWRAIAISSVVFALEHHLWFAGLVAGVAYAWVYVRTGNLWVPVLAHAVTNGLLGAWVLWTGSWTFW